MLQGVRNVTRELTSDEQTEGKLSLNRLISLAAAVVLSYAFVKNSLSGHPLTWDLLMGYSVAMAMAASPTLAGKFLGLRYGNGSWVREGRRGKK